MFFDLFMYVCIYLYMYIQIHIYINVVKNMSQCTRCLKQISPPTFVRCFLAANGESGSSFARRGTLSSSCLEVTLPKSNMPHTQEKKGALEDEISKIYEFSKKKSEESC